MSFVLFHKDGNKLFEILFNYNVQLVENKLLIIRKVNAKRLREVRGGCCWVRALKTPGKVTWHQLRKHGFAYTILQPVSILDPRWFSASSLLLNRFLIYLLYVSVPMVCRGWCRIQVVF